VSSGHGHAHGQHGHAHGSEQTSAYPFLPAKGEQQRSDLLRGAGRDRILFLDCPSGISGDMVLSALLDLGVPRAVFDDAITALGLGAEARLTVESGHAGVIFATRLRVEVQGAPPPRTYASIRAAIEASRLNAGTISRALAVFERLAIAEARVHGTTPSEVTFHEVGATDSIVDIVCVAAALDFLGARLFVGPLPLGRGFVMTQHGRLPLPAPATLLCLEGVPTLGDPLAVELVTPTGAAIAGALADGFSTWPALVPERVGWGAGTLELPDRPNVVRAVLGAPPFTGASSDRVLLLEANVDDMTGELVSHALSQLLAAGALDAWIVPITMKKGRPAFILCALVKSEHVPAVEAAYFRETATLGVRRREVERTTLSREVSEVPTRFGPVPVKQSGSPPHHYKPEFDACVAIAERHGVPVRLVIDEALAQARSRR
jgi:pyridinium-3,5-bisthiocarboxylic acid mononucleotide nickel chelatase